MIHPTRIDQVARILERAGLSEQTVGALRDAFRDLHLTYCMDEEVGMAEPVRCGEGFNIYLVAGRGHCMGLTSDPEEATGMILAEVEAEMQDD